MHKHAHLYYKCNTDNYMGTLAVRLDSECEALLKRLVRATGRTKSRVVREALLDYSRRHAGARTDVTPYELMKDGIGIWSSGAGGLSERTGEKFTEMLLEDKRARDSRRRGTARRASR